MLNALHLSSMQLYDLQSAIASYHETSANISFNSREPDSWLERERRKRKRSLIWGFVIFFGVILLVTGGVIVWWLARHNWLQKVEP